MILEVIMLKLQIDRGVIRDGENLRGRNFQRS